MKHPWLGSSIHGIIPPLITPLTSGLDLDIPALEKLLEHVLKGGVHGIFLLGSTGEGPSLTEGIRKALIRESIRVASGRVPVFVNISAPSFLEACRMAEYAAQEGAGYVVLSPPYYYDMNSRELLGITVPLQTLRRFPWSYTTLPDIQGSRWRLPLSENLSIMKTSWGSRTVRGRWIT